MDSHEPGATNGQGKLRALAPLWPLLPAFRVVAECEHLPTGATMLGVTTSTLSRSIAALERAVGKRLFRRSGRSLRLDTHGKALLAKVRDAMRWVEDGVAGLSGPAYRGDFVVASICDGTTALIAPRLAELRLRHPGLVPHVVTRLPSETAAELLGGRIDISFQAAAVARPGLVTEPVASIQRRVYCGRRHPLFARDRVAALDLAAVEFVAPPADPSGLPADGWPPQLPRRIAMVVDQLGPRLDVCASLPLLAVLPCVVAAEHREKLRPLPVDLVPPSIAWAIYRRPLGVLPTAASELVASMRRAADGPA
jgi:DNA-binding transcriptional LysR family regulator